jgi:hypothetical protein
VDPERGRSALTTATRLRSSGEIDAAIEELEVGLPLLEQLAERNPTAFRPLLRRALVLSADCYRRKGQTVLAMTKAVQEVSTMRLLAAANPANLTIELARSLRRLSVYQLAGGEASAAYIARVEAATIVGQLATANPERYGKEWLDMLFDKWKALNAARLFREQKIEVLSELLSASAALAAADPFQFASEHIKILKIARDEVRYTTIQLPIAASLRAARRRHLWVLLAKPYRTLIRKSKRPA